MNWIYEKILKIIGKKLDGKKTFIGGIGYVLTGLLGLLRVTFPDLVIVIPMGIEESMENISLGMLGIGGGHKLVKAGKK